MKGTVCKEVLKKLQLLKTRPALRPADLDEPGVPLDRPFQRGKFQLVISNVNFYNMSNKFEPFKIQELKGTAPEVHLS